MTTLIFIIAFCIVAVLVYMARYSGRLRVSATRLIDAPILEVYAKVADFRRWGEWSPWLEHEPEARVTLSARPDAEDACYAWDGARIGAGEIRHLRLIHCERIEQTFRCLDPFRFRGRAVWKFIENAGKTEVTWEMKGRVGFALRAFAPTVQGMIAFDYRYGLDKLAGLLEPAEAPHYSIAYPGLRDIPATRYVSRTYDGSLNGLGAALSSGFKELQVQLDAHGIPASDRPIAVYAKTNIRLRTTVCHMGLPISDPGFDSMKVRTLPAHRAYVVRLQGSCTALEVAWYEAMQRMRMENLKPDQRLPPFERYLIDADGLSENGRVTELLLPVRIDSASEP